MHTLGIDEAGRGALAGPVVVAVIAIPKGFYPRGNTLPPLRDSKKLSPLQRGVWMDYIKNHDDLFYATARVYQGLIDRRNISISSNIAASRALDRIIAQNPVKPGSILLDGSLYLHKPSHKEFDSRTIIKGDEKFTAIKLASIVAKTTRDAYMVKLGGRYPEYEFERHKGYGTLLHRNRIKKHGVSEVHRLTYIKI
jgi:ribonuclease HII